MHYFALVKGQDGSEDHQSCRIHIRVLRKTNSQPRVMQASHHYRCLCISMRCHQCWALFLIKQPLTCTVRKHVVWSQLKALDNQEKHTDIMWSVCNWLKKPPRQLWAATLRIIGKDPAFRRRHQKSDTVKASWNQTVVNWWLVKSDHRDRSSFFSAVNGHRRSYLRPCLHCMPVTQQRGCLTRTITRLRRPSWAVSAHRPSLLHCWPHVSLSLRQQPNYACFIELHSIFILIMLNGAVNKWLALVQSSRNWWEMQMTGNWVLVPHSPLQNRSFIDPGMDNYSILVPVITVLK